MPQLMASTSVACRRSAFQARNEIPRSISTDVRVRRSSHDSPPTAHQSEGIENHEDCSGRPAASPYAPQQHDVYSGPETTLPSCDPAPSSA